MEDHRYITIAISGLIGYFANLDWEFLIIYLIMMVLDVLIAIIYAANSGHYKSRTNCLGLYNKVAEFLTLLALLLVQRVTIKSGINIPFSPAITVMFIFKEMGSILETLATNGVKLPHKIMKWFEKTLDEVNGTETGEEQDNKTE